MNKRIRRVDAVPSKIETRQAYNDGDFSSDVLKELKVALNEIGEGCDTEDTEIDEEESSYYVQAIELMRTSKERMEATKRSLGYNTENVQYNPSEPTEGDYLRMPRQVKVYLNQFEKEADSDG